MGTVGRLSPEKGIDRLVMACGRLIGSGMDVRLLILGEGPERPGLEDLIEKNGLADRVLMPGFANSQRHLPRLDVFVLPSLTEGLPMCVLEAMRARVPIVASRVGGVPGVLSEGDGGLLVEPDDIEGLTHAINQLLSDRMMAARLVGVSAAKIHEFSSERMADRYLDVYAELTQRYAPATGGQVVDISDTPRGLGL